MPRPRCRRRICFRPGITFFKPAGIPARELKMSALAFEELEAVRLKDYLGMGQEDAARKMHISQPTFHRLITEARKKIADALVNGKAISIEGGHFEIRQDNTEEKESRGKNRQRQAIKGQNINKRKY